jgi:hypothetical protein
MEMENGGLGVARLNEPAKLTLYSLEVNPKGDLERAQIKVIELENVLPINGHSIYSNILDLRMALESFLWGQMIAYLVLI